MPDRRMWKEQSSQVSSQTAHVRCRRTPPKGEGAFVKLAKKLEEHAVVLDLELKHQERALRAELIKGFKLYRESCKVLGRLLYQYKLIFKGRLLWIKIVQDLTKILKYSQSTLLRYVKLHEIWIGVRKPRASKRAHVQPLIQDALQQSAPLSYQDERLFLTRAGFREMLAAYQESERLQVLKHVISVEAYETWGLRERLFLEITPAPSQIVISQERGAIRAACNEDEIASGLTLDGVAEEDTPQSIPDDCPSEDSELD